VSIPEHVMLAHPDRFVRHGARIISPLLVSPTIPPGSLFFLKKNTSNINLRHSTIRLTGGHRKLTIHKYGRDANPNLRRDILHSIASLRSYFLRIRRLTYQEPITVIRGIIKCHIEFTLLQRLSTEDVRAALNAIDVRYSDSDWSLREILEAEIKVGAGGRGGVPAATLRLEFLRL